MLDMLNCCNMLDCGNMVICCNIICCNGFICCNMLVSCNTFICCCKMFSSFLCCNRRRYSFYNGDEPLFILENQKPVISPTNSRSWLIGWETVESQITLWLTKNNASIVSSGTHRLWWWQARNSQTLNQVPWGLRSILSGPWNKTI